jgi:acetyl-CoA acetyltransferase
VLTVEPRRYGSPSGREDRSRCATAATSRPSATTRAASHAAYRIAGFGAERVEVAQLHDAFTPFELISLEDTGLVPPGKAGRATLDGETSVGGRLPINPSGGLKARGHPLAATGISQIVELCWQLRGKAEGRQVPARVGLAQSIGGLATNNWVTLVEARR